MSAQPRPRRGRLPPRDQEAREFAQAFAQSQQLKLSGLSKGGISSKPPVRHRVAAPLESLRPTTLAEVVTHVNEISRGRVLFAKTAQLPPFRLSAIFYLLEDENGDLLRFGLYNVAEEACSDLEKLPPGTPLALIEPFAKDSMSGGITLRCDNPQCVVVFHDEATWAAVQADSRRFPELGVGSFARRGLDAGWSASQLRERGNVLFKERATTRAYDHYTAAASLAGAHGSERAKALANAALCCMSTRHWEDAERLSAAALEADPSHTKSLYRRTMSLMWLGRWEEAFALADHLDGSTPSNARLVAALERARAELSGVYDVAELRKTEGRQVDALPHANHLTEKAEVVQTASMGRGVRATAVIKKSELVLAEYAFVRSGAGQSQSGGMATMDMASRRMDAPGQAAVLPSVLAELERNSALLNKVHSLAVGPAEEGVRLPPRSGRRYDLDCIDRVLHNNWFRVDEMPASAGAVAGVTGTERGSALQRRDTGLWLDASLFNHSCAPNCSYTNMGAFMLVFAARDIAVGEELTVSYLPLTPRDTMAARRKKLAGFGDGFTCRCIRCEQVAANGELSRLERQVAGFAADFAGETSPAGERQRSTARGSRSQRASPSSLRAVEGKLEDMLRSSDQALLPAVAMPLSWVRTRLFVGDLNSDNADAALRRGEGAVAMLERAGCPLHLPDALQVTSLASAAAAAAGRLKLARRLLITLYTAASAYGWPSASIDNVASVAIEPTPPSLAELLREAVATAGARTTAATQTQKARRRRRRKRNKKKGASAGEGGAEDAAGQQRVGTSTPAARRPVGESRCAVQRSE